METESEGRVSRLTAQRLTDNKNDFSLSTHTHTDTHTHTHQRVFTNRNSVRSTIPTVVIANININDNN